MSRGVSAVRLISVVTCLLLLLAPPLQAQAAPAVVEIVEASYRPQTVRIEPSGTVEWHAIDGGHTVTSADPSRAAFRFPSSSGTMAAGTTASFRFEQPGVYLFFCELHGSSGGFPNGMTGAVYVGVDPPTGPSPEIRSVPSPAYPTLASAADGIPPGSTIAVAPGTYRIDREIQLTTDGTALRPSSAGAVVLEPAAAPDGSPPPSVGIVAAADSVTIQGLTLRGFSWAGVMTDRASGTRLVDVTAEGGRHGLRLLRPRSGGVTRPVVSGASAVGISVVGCGAEHRSCPHVLDGRIAGGDIGVLVDRSGALLVRGTTMDGTSTGIRVVASPAALVVGNRVRGRAVGIDVAGPTTDVRVVANVVDAPVGLKWDGAGAGVCFSRNTNGAGGEPATDPLLLQTLFPCS